MAGLGEGLTQGTAAGKAIIDMRLARKRLGFEERQTDVLYGKNGFPGTVERQTDINQRQLALEASRQDIERERTGIMERETALKEQTAENEYYKGLKERPIRFGVLATGIIKDVPGARPLLQPIIDDINNDKIQTRAQLRDTLMQKHAAGEFSSFRANLLKDMEAAQRKGDTEKFARYKGLYDATGEDKFEDFVDDLMGKPMHMRRTATERFGSGGASGDAGAMKAYTKDGGKTVDYFPSKLGPPEGQGYKPYDAGGMVMTVSPDGRVTYATGSGAANVLSATETGKLSDLQVATQNLDRMMELVKDNPNADMTGFWEIANKYIDNWNILGKQDRGRAELRQRVALGLKFMYDVMGRQLAVQEMQKGAPMLPDMKVDEKVFADRVGVLKGYINALILAKKEALRAAGYAVPDIGPLDYTNKGTIMAMKSRASVIEDELRAKGVKDDATLNSMIQAQLRTEFGLE